MNITSLIFGILFLVFGALLACGKIHRKMNFWKQMPEKEKSRINIRLLCLNIGEVIMLDGLILVLKGVLPAFSSNWFVISIVAWIMIAGFDVWYITKSDKYVLSKGVMKND